MDKLNRVKKWFASLMNLNKFFTRAQLIDSWAIRVQSLTSFLLFASFIFFTYSSIYGKPMTLCKNKQNNQEIGEYFSNLCLSYSFTNGDRYHTNPESRVYVPHYRWINWVIFFLFFIHLLPMIACKIASRTEIQNMMNDKENLKANQLNEKREPIFLAEIGWNAHLYRNNIFCHLFSLFITIFAILTIDTLLENRFISLIYWHPFSMDYEKLRNYISLLFPYSVDCHIGPQMMIQSYGTTMIGCYLNYMEHYKLFFIGAWFWMAFSLICNILVILKILLLGFSSTEQLNLIKTKSEWQEGDSKKVAELYSVGDLMALSMIRHVIDEHTYRLALNKIARQQNCDEMKMEEECPTDI